MKISEVSESTGLPATTLRYYETVGLLQPQRAANGYRTYEADVLDRLQFIEAAKSLDLPLEQIAELVGVWESESCGSVKASLAPAVQAHLSHLDTVAADLAALRASLTGSLEHLDALADRDEPCTPTCTFLEETAAARPLACNLARADHDVQVRRWRALVDRAHLTRSAGGVRLRVEAGDVAEAAELAQRERECCQFLTITMVFADNGCLLSVDAPPSAADVIDDIFGPTAPAA